MVPRPTTHAQARRSVFTAPWPRVRRCGGALADGATVTGSPSRLHDDHDGGERKAPGMVCRPGCHEAAGRREGCDGGWRDGDS
jgi:hypothetical protein